jgi:hypothetical protein
VIEVPTVINSKLSLDRFENKVRFEIKNYKNNFQHTPIMNIENDS